MPDNDGSRSIILEGFQVSTMQIRGISIKRFVALALFCAFSAVVGYVLAQPPGAGPGRFELGRLLPPGIRDQLNLDPDQARGIAALEQVAREKLERILTPEQKLILSNSRPPFGPGRGSDIQVRPSNKPGPTLSVGAPLTVNKNNDEPKIEIKGDIIEGVLGDAAREGGMRGVRLLSAVDRNTDGQHAGSASWTIEGLKPSVGRWYSFRVRALVQDGFKVEKAGFPRLTVSFFRDNGTNSLDQISKSMSDAMLRDRDNLKDEGTNKNLGDATWRWHGFEFRTPFPEVDTVKLSISFEGGAGAPQESELWISEVAISPIPDRSAVEPIQARPFPAKEDLVPIGGRWYYDSAGGSRSLPTRFDHTNAGRLVYMTDKPETPFAGNMSSWLRRGYLDQKGQPVEQDQYVPEAVVISFEGKQLVMRSRNLPNHPTGVFPDRSRWLDGNPNIIRDQSYTWRLPLEPKENPRHIAMDERNSNRALPMGPIGVATNGVVFFNPFDHGTVDAVWRLDRCCGHPSPGQEYHYHKYPVCINTPWVDDGAVHSPLIGFAFDGFPVYGPYEEAGKLARDHVGNPLNAFNLHNDPARGPHYHVTPGKYPHIIGGYWGVTEPQRRRG